MDRETSRKNMAGGLMAAGFATAFFALSFVAAFLYVAPGMSEHRRIPEPGETIYAPQPSWAPIFLAIGALGLVCGSFAAGFIFSPFIWGLIGAVFFLAAFRSLVRGGIRGFYRLPRKQRVRSAALPVETLKP